MKDLFRRGVLLSIVAFMAFSSVRMIPILEAGITVPLSGPESVVISEGVEEIKEGEFLGCSDLGTVTFPATLKRLKAGRLRGT